MIIFCLFIEIDTGTGVVGLDHRQDIRVIDTLAAGVLRRGKAAQKGINTEFKAYGYLRKT